jgi:tetratricopeptide (TPR) repeat protein
VGENKDCCEDLYRFKNKISTDYKSCFPAKVFIFFARSMAKKNTAPASRPIEGYYSYIVFFCAFLVYFNAIFNDYNLDDDLVTRNHRLTSQGISSIPEIFTTPYFKNETYAFEYRPVVLTSFAIEHTLFGESAAVSHFFNVLLYALLCMLLFNTLKKLLLTYSIIVPFIAAMLFAVHPIHTEVVASIKNRDEILALLGAAGAWYYCLRFIDTQKWWTIALAAVLLLAGLLSKISIVPLIFIIPLSLVVFRRPALQQVSLITAVLTVVAFPFVKLSLLQYQLLVIAANFLVIIAAYLLLQPAAEGVPFLNKRKLLQLGGILAILVALYGVARLMPEAEQTRVRGIQIRIGEVNRSMSYIEAPVWVTDAPDIRLGTAGVVLGKYLRLALVPYPMAYYYGFAEVVPTSVFTAKAIFYLSLYALLAAMSLVLMKRSPLIAFGIVLYLAGLAPFATIAEPVAGMLGDRYLFIPSLGVALAVAGLLQFFGVAVTDTANNKISALPKPLRYVLGAVLALYSIGTIARNNDWKDMLTLCAADIHAVENSAQAHNLYGYHLAVKANTGLPPEQHKTRQEAIVHFKRALEIYPELLNAQFDLGRMYELTGQYDSAVAAYCKTLAIDTNFAVAALRIGVLKDSKGDIAGAIPYYEFSLRKAPDDPGVYNSLSFAWYRLKDYNRSLEILRAAHNRFPDKAEPAINMAKTFTNIFMKDSAILYLEMALERRPNDPKILQSLVMLSNETMQTDRENYYKQKLNSLPRR